MKLGMGLSQNLEQKLQLKQILSPVMIQSMRMLNMPYQQLTEQIANEAQDNVVLEVSGQDQLISYLKDMARDIPTLKAPSSEKFDYVSNIASSGDNLYDHLMVQLELEYLDEIDFKVCSELIKNIDNRGYMVNFAGVKSDIIKSLGVKENKVKDNLRLIQTFEPAGVGARNLKESLLLQVEAHNFDDDPEIKQVLVSMIKDYFEELADKDFETIAMELFIDIEDVELAADFIENNLKPYPVEDMFAREETNYIVPSFEIVRKDGEYKFVNLEKTKGIKINFNQKYLRLLEDPATDEKTKEFIKDKLEKAKQLVDMINRRNDMIEKVGDIIVNKQKDFFDHGVHSLMPVTQKYLAGEAGVHPSTISRAVASKYVLTPVGILPLKYLCPREVSGVTTERIKYIMNDIISENPKMSDQQIAEHLERFEIYIKRRTVAKYRSLMEMPSSYERSH